MHKEMNLSVIVPVFQSAESLDRLHQRLESVLLSQLAQTTIIYVDDCSEDNTLTVLHQIASRSTVNTKVVELTVNVGQLHATALGISYARDGVVVTIDDDLQQWPEDIPKLVDHFYKNNYDFIQGVFNDPKHGKLRKAASSFSTRLTVYELGVDKATRFSSFVVFDKSLFLNTFGEPLHLTRVKPGWMHHISKNSGLLPVRHSERKSGHSTYTLKKLFKAFLPLTTALSAMTLAISGIFSFLILALSAIGIAVTMLRYLLLDGTLPGFTSLVLLNLATLGALGASTSIVISQLKDLKKVYQSIPVQPVKKVTTYGAV
jgi:glycosyltransferase involved in cell wall biosynthesis